MNLTPKQSTFLCLTFLVVGAIVVLISNSTFLLVSGLVIMFASIIFVERSPKKEIVPEKADDLIKQIDYEEDINKTISQIDQTLEYMEEEEE